MTPRLVIEARVGQSFYREWFLAEWNNACAAKPICRKGLQSFFVTVAVSGRRELLSTLGGEGARPALTRLGEIVWVGLMVLIK